MSQQYKTTDIVLAAFLRLNHCNMTNIEKVGQKGTFVFGVVPEELLQVYDLGQGSVEPVAFNNMVKQLTTAVRRMD